MSAKVKRSWGSTLALFVLGALALCLGPRSLSLLIPVAALVWYTAPPELRSGRN